MSTSLHLGILLVAAALFTAAAVVDVRSYRIPNYLCGLLLLLFPAYVATAPHPIDWLQNIAVFGLISAIGFAAFWRSLAGAGDVKLLSVASLWAGPHFVPVLLVVMAFAGGLEALAFALALSLKRQKNLGGPRLGKTPIPYGVAIALGGVTTLGLMAHPILLSD